MSDNRDVLKKIDDLEEDLNTIKIKNGNGRMVRYDRNEFHQNTYDTLRLKGFWGSVMKVVGALILIGQLLITIKVLTE